MSEKWKHDALAADLAEHLRGPERLVWTDMQLGPSGSPRPDVYSIPKSYSRFTPIAYECKISVADFRADVTKGKWQSYLQFASAVVFAVPVGLIGKADVPAGCGLMVRGDEGWRTVKGPTLRPTDNLPLAAWQKLLMDGIGRLAERRHRDRLEPRDVWAVENVTESHAIDRVRRRVGDDVASYLQDRERARRDLEYAQTRSREAQQAADQEYQKLLRAARERAEQDAQVSDGARAELCAALGLPATATQWAIRNAARMAVARLDRDAEVQRLRNELETIRRALNSGLAPMPAIATEDGHVSHQA